MNDGYADTVMKAGSVSCSYSYLFYAAVIRETISMNGNRWVLGTGSQIDLEFYRNRNHVLVNYPYPKDRGM